MPVQLTWRCDPARPSSTTDRVHLGLELGGDDARADGPGVVRLFEVGGVGRDAGAAEASEPRLIASWHGTLHRDAAAPATARVTFELEGAAARLRSTIAEPLRSCGWQVEGFDPECVYGVDGVRLSFVNRGFFCFFPFLLDATSEGGSLELLAALELPGGERLAESHVQSLPLRREREVLTTTRAVDDRTPTYERYTGEQVGCTVVHHTGYLLHAASKARTEAWPETVDSALAPLPRGRGGFDFAPYDGAARPLTVVLDVDLAAGHVPDAGWLGRNGHGATAEQVQGWVRDEAAAHVVRLFEDAGFSGARALWSDAPEARWSDLTARFARGGRFDASPGWHLRDGREGLDVDFWTFHVVADPHLPPGVLGRSLATDFVDGGRVGSRDYYLPCARPIGAGTKRLTVPIRIVPGLARAVLVNRGGGERTFADVAALEARARAMARKLAIVVAHEVAHGLGLMHEAYVVDGAPYPESSAKPLASVMCSAAEEGTFGLDMTFSSQAKRIWQECFGVAPRLEAPHLRNKTWTDADRATTSWEARTHAFFERAGESEGASFAPVPADAVPPFCSLEAPQRGTHVGGG